MRTMGEQALNDANIRVGPAAVQQWQGWRLHALDRARPPLGRLMAAFLITGGVWAGLSTYLKKIATGQWDAGDFRQGVVTVVVCAAILLYLHLLKRATVKALCELRPVVPIPADHYERLAQRILMPRRGAEPVLLGISVVLVVCFFVLQPNELLIASGRTVLYWLALIFVAAFTCLSIWIVLTLVYCGFRSSLGLRALAESPLIVNAFDNGGLLPFGRLGVMHSLAFLGVVLIPMIFLGPPRAGGGYAVGALSLLSLAVLFIPLWGVHRQIVRAHGRVLDMIAADLMDVQARLLAGGTRDPDELKLLYDQAERLNGLRKVVMGGPTWPFRHYGIVAWVVTALLLPSLVTLMSLFAREILFPLIAH